MSGLRGGIVGKCPLCLGEGNYINILLIVQKSRDEGKILWRNVVGVEERETFEKILEYPKLSI